MISDPKRLRIEGVPELWLESRSKPRGSTNIAYRPAALVECVVNFRSLRAGLNHSEDRSFAAWVPEGQMAIDWDTPAVSLDAARIGMHPEPGIAYLDGDFQLTREAFTQYQDELMDWFVRNEKLRVFYNPVFGLYSSPGDPLEDFLSLIAEAALRRVEPELKHLRRRFELQLEQIREAQARRGQRAEGLGLDRLELTNLHLFESENRLASIFSTLAGTVFGTTEPRRQEEFEQCDSELRDDLGRVEREASEALRALYDEYLTLANEYDVFEIGLQPDNVQMTRLGLLWVPVAGAPPPEVR
jgi:hypothetical protein